MLQFLRQGKTSLLTATCRPCRSDCQALLRPSNVRSYVFAGQDGLTLAFCKLGGDCCRGGDIIGVIDCIDLRTAAGKIRLLEACADPRVVYSAFGPPCGSFCRVYVNLHERKGDWLPVPCFTRRVRRRPWGIILRSLSPRESVCWIGLGSFGL